MPILLPDWLTQRALATPGRLALVAAGERLTFSELDARVSAVAAWLRTLGIERGDRVALLVRSGLHFTTLVHAISRAQAVLVPFNLRLTAPELGWQLQHVAARLLVCEAPTAGLAEAAAEGLSYVKVVQAERTSPGRVEPEPFDLESPHSILFTSGTSGPPKGAILTYGNHWWSAMGSALNLGTQPGDRWLACLPLYHVGGLSILLRCVIYGATVLVQESFGAVDVNRAIDEDGVTHVSMVAAMLSRVLDARAGRRFPPGLRAVLLGGGPAPQGLLERCFAQAAPVLPTYGLTEAASQVATLSPDDIGARPGSAGKALATTEVHISAPADDGAGEIVIRGPSVTPGYWRNAEATSKALRDGWFHTGDIGRLDADGYLYVLDRRTDLIISGGENIYPAEVESVLSSHPAVAEAGVTGLPDAHWGQAPVALVVCRRPVTEADLTAWCAARLARYKVPRKFHMVSSLPRTAGGKLIRRSLAELLPSSC